MRSLALAVLAAALSAFPAPPAVAQQPKTHRIGWLVASPSAGVDMVEVIKGFSDALRDLGHVEGRNLVVERRHAERGPADLPRLASELVNLKVEVIVTDTTLAAQAAQAATKTIPIVMAVSVSPVETGLVASLARPGANVTGLMFPPEMDIKRVELIKELLPGATRLAVLGTATSNPQVALRLREVESEAKRLGMTVTMLEVQGPEPDFERLFRAAAAAKAQGLLVLASPTFLPHKEKIAALATRHRLPAMYFVDNFVEVGGLMSYAPDIDSMFRRAAGYVDMILRGRKPSDLPVEQPTKFKMTLNLKTARELGITFPPALLNMADQVIQ